MKINGGCRKLTDKCVKTGRCGEAQAWTKRVMMSEKLMLCRENTGFVVKSEEVH